MAWGGINRSVNEFLRSCNNFLIISSYNRYVKLKSSPVILTILLISLLLNGYLLLNRQSNNPIATEIVDGDTFILSSGERVRLLGVNAPETGRCLANEAKQLLSDLILNKPIEMKEEHRDNFNRRMGLVYLNDTLINTRLIEEGLGKPDYTKNSHSDEFIDAFNYAKEHNLGVNSDVCKKTNADLPPDPNCTIKGNIDKATGDHFYHLPSCRHYAQIVLDLDSGEDYFCSEKEAQTAGFTLAKDCLR